MQQELTTYQQRAKIDIVDVQSLQQATSTLSWLNTQLDNLTAEKEKVTKPLNEALKAERNRFKPAETILSNAIDTLRQNISMYVTAQQRIATEQEQKILADKRTSTDTKINKLATIENTATDKVTTEQGSISFITVKKYRVTDIAKIPLHFLQVNDDLIKQALKENSPIAGIEYYTEQSIRNYR
jgi:hypothetical protein